MYATTCVNTKREKSDTKATCCYDSIYMTRPEEAIP